MRRFMFRCPGTGLVVKGQADDPRPGEAPHTYQPVHCSACKGSHLVDPKTGETWQHQRHGMLDETPSETPERRFPKPWRADETDVYFIIRDQNGLVLAYVYFEETDRPEAVNVLTRDEARRVATNLAKSA